MNGMWWKLGGIGLGLGIGVASADLSLTRINERGQTELVLSLREEGISTETTLIEPAKVAGDHWALAGNLREQAGAIVWTPAYRIIRRNKEPGREVRYDAEVSGSWSEPEPGGLTVFETWKSARRAPGLLVFGWVVDGEVKHVKTCWHDGRLTDRDGRLSVRFELSQSEASGVPMVLFRNTKGWVAPRTTLANADNAAFQAVMWDDEAALTAALARGARALRPMQAGSSLLSIAAGAGRVALLRTLLASAKRSERVSLPMTENAAVWAAERGRLEVVETLRAAGVTFTGAADWFTKPLEGAIAGNHGEIFQAILASGDLAWGKFALAQAVAAGRLEWVKAAILRHPEFMLDRREKAAALYAQVRVGNLAMVEWLLQQGAEDLVDDAVTTSAVLLTDSAGRQPDLTMDLRGYLTAAPRVTTVPLAGPDRSPVQLGFPLFRSPVIQGRPMPAPERSARLVVPTSGAESPLLVAVRRQDLAMTGLLLDHGLDPNAPNPSGATALIIAARDGNLPLVRRLLAAGADVTRTMEGGWSALHFAALSDSPELCSALLAAGANPRAIDDGGLTPMVVAWRAGAFRSATLLAQLDPEALGPGEWSGLLAQRAIAVDALPLLRLLQERVPDCRVSAQLSLLDAAKLAGASRCIAWLSTPGQPDRDVALVEARDVAGKVKVKQSVELVDPRTEYADYPGLSVVVSFVIDLDGTVRLAGVDAAVPPLVRAAALGAIESWTFEPLIHAGRPVRTRAQYRFELPPVDRRLRPDAAADSPSRIGGAKQRLPKSRGQGPGLIEFTVDADGYASDVVILQAGDLQTAAAYWAWVLSKPVTPAESAGRKLHSRRVLSWYE